MNKDPLPIYQGIYSKDICYCGLPATSGCRCFMNHRWCAEGHTWRRGHDGERIIEDATEAHKRVAEGTYERPGA